MPPIRPACMPLSCASFVSDMHQRCVCMCVCVLWDCICKEITTIIAPSYLLMHPHTHVPVHGLRVLVSS